jgi:hypothetical protein
MFRHEHRDAVAMKEINEVHLGLPFGKRERVESLSRAKAYKPLLARSGIIPHRRLFDEPFRPVVDRRLCFGREHDSEENRKHRTSSEDAPSNWV